MQSKLANDPEFNIQTIGVVLNYYAGKEYHRDFSDLTKEQQKKVVGKYNAEDPAKQKKYSDYVYEYRDPLKEILK
ncbi:hypothetical protein CHM34_10270 [Paludifilum halophilum]|uniref:Uncharacterized protein n=1 Tax=Paludifilum halophilum TaxID=1642702 RepID=A0A235B780_9BACL|nr:hypothetical protein CHM34_10270 [Paludifilum halophilum]